ncbi:unnamed protein product [Arctia plantaginis]|uniref:Uncharacterized protein n=1 Tax=Arctia plantaginis TaxID=874455 RepID=A0A8S1AYH7_ARCPL|nr:unnamed protein product [Arctia plantaginis]
MILLCCGAALYMTSTSGNAGASDTRVGCFQRSRCGATSSRSGQQILLACKRCLPEDTKIKVHVSSLKNLKQHVRRVHESQYGQFEEIVKAGSNQGKTKRRTHSDNDNINDDDSTSSSNPTPVKRRIQHGLQLSIGESFGIAATGSGVPQAKVDKCIVNLFVSNMIPLHVVESKSFGALIKTLNPSKNSISRRTLGRRITDEHIELKQHLISANLPRHFTLSSGRYGWKRSRVDTVKKCMEKKIEDALRQEAAENSKDRDSLSGGGSNASNNDDDEEDFFNSVTQSRKTK